MTHLIIIRHGKYLGSYEAVLLERARFWKFRYWKRINFARGSITVVCGMVVRWEAKYGAAVRDRTELAVKIKTEEK